MHGITHARCGFPVVSLAFEVTVEETTQVIDVRFVVVIRPLLSIVDAQPFVLRSNSSPTAEGAGGVQCVGIAGDNVRRHIDAREVGDFVLPQLVHQRVARCFSEDVFFVVLAEETAVLQQTGESEIGHATAQHKVAVHVTDAFPRVDGFQCSRLLGSGKPLRNGQVRGAAHADIAAAP
ncbi:hypothetical protein D3C87_1657040 [compost metagenome]